MKKTAVIYENGVPIKVIDVKDLPIEEFLKIKHDAEENAKKVAEEKASKDKALRTELDHLGKEIAKCQVEIRYLKGEIDEKEYERLCNQIGKN